MRAYSLEVGAPPEARLSANRAKQVASKPRWLSARRCQSNFLGRLLSW
jgi:hypothetical protein